MKSTLALLQITVYTDQTAMIKLWTNTPDPLVSMHAKIEAFDFNPVDLLSFIVKGRKD